jgi:hypothetical protein
MPPSFLIQRSRDQRSFASFPGLIAGYHVFRRLSMPRHPPCTLRSLTTVTDPRPVSGQETGRTTPAGNGSDQSHSRGGTRPQPPAPPASLPYGPATRSEGGVNHAHRSRQKGARRSPPAKTEDHANASRGDRSLFCRGARLGGYRRTHLSINLLLNLYSLVKEHRSGKPPRNEHDRLEADHARIVK